MLDYAQSAGLKAVEIGTGGNPGNHHCPVDALLESKEKRKQYLHEIHSRGLKISAFSCHDNPLSPNKAYAEASHDIFVKTVKLAEMLDVPVVNCFSGAPGDHEGAKHPNWPIIPWPTEYSEIYKWQWEEKLIPYWKEWGKFAQDHHVKIGIE